MESCSNKQEDVSDILAKDLAKRLIEKDNQDNRKVKRIKNRPINYDEDLDDLNLKNQTPDEIIANTLENLASLNDLLNHALDKTLGLNEQKTSSNLIDSSSNNLSINDKKKSINNQQSDVNNDKKSDDHLFKVPALPTKKLCKHKKLKEKLLLKESAAKNLVDKLVESQLTNENLNLKELIKDNKLIDDNESIKKHKKKKKDHRCSKHRKRKESDEFDELNLDKPDSSTSKTNNLSPKEHYFEDDDDYFKFKDKSYNHKNHYQDNYYDDDRNYSKRSSSSNRRYHYDQVDYYSDEDIHDSRSTNRKYESKYNNYKYYDKLNERNYDYHNKEFDNSKFDYTDPSLIKKLREKNSITNWTKFCNKLSKESANDDNSSICSNDFYSDDDDKRSIISDRILARDSLLKSKEIKFEVRDFKSRQARSANEIKQELLDQFPVSSGLNHLWKEVDKPSNDKKDKDDKKKKKKADKEQELIEDKVNDFINKHVNNNNNNGFDIGSIMSQRLNALKILEKDVNNLTALNQLKEANELINKWSSSKSDGSSDNKTEESNKQPLTLADQINSSEHYKAVDDFTNAVKNKCGIGMALLVKMGWQPGQGLGKNNEGCVEPIIPELKLDTKGLITEEEKNLAKKNNVQAMYNIPQIGDQSLIQKIRDEDLTRIANQSIINGKHPVNILQEVCYKRKWKQATYTIINEDGPAHKRTFQYKCTLNNVDYIASFSSPNKKLAKAISAIVCLQSFGLISTDAD